MSTLQENLAGCYKDVQSVSLYNRFIHSYACKPSAHIVVHIHVFIAGYLFTISLLYIDPVSHRFSFLFRTVVFILALAGHGILSKFIYAYPPEGVLIEQASVGAMLMYYGGDAVDLLLIIILFKHWYQSNRPRSSASNKNQLEKYA